MSRISDSVCHATSWAPTNRAGIRAPRAIVHHEKYQTGVSASIIPAVDARDVVRPKETAPALLCAFGQLGKTSDFRLRALMIYLDIANTLADTVTSLLQSEEAKETGREIVTFTG